MKRSVTAYVNDEMKERVKEMASAQGLNESGFLSTLVYKAWDEYSRRSSSEYEIDRDDEFEDADLIGE